MVRRTMTIGLVLCLWPSAALAGKTSTTFSVGITIGGGTHAPAKTYTWGAAAISVMEAGFKKAKPVAESGTLYWFEAERHGSTYRVAVSAASGEIVKIIPA